MGDEQFAAEFYDRSSAEYNTFLADRANLHARQDKLIADLTVMITLGLNGVVSNGAQNLVGVVSEATAEMALGKGLGKLAGPVATRTWEFLVRGGKIGSSIEQSLPVAGKLQFYGIGCTPGGSAPGCSALFYRIPE